MKKSILCLFLALIGAAHTFAQTPTPAPGTVEAEKVRADRAESRFNNFANYNRYKDANAQLAAPTKDENRVVFMGDSITDFWKLNEYFPNQPYINRGISGQTTSQMLLRFRGDVIDLKPKVVIIFAGTNDISFNTGPITLEQIEGNLMSMAELARANGIKVILASLTPVSDYNKNKAGEMINRTVQRPPAQILELNKWIKHYAAQNDFVYLDYFSATVDDKGFLKVDIANDGLHPNAQGYAIMKPLAEEAIKTALKKKRKK